MKQERHHGLRRPRNGSGLSPAAVGRSRRVADYSEHFGSTQPAAMNSGCSLGSLAEHLLSSKSAVPPGARATKRPGSLAWRGERVGFDRRWGGWKTRAKNTHQLRSENESMKTYSPSVPKTPAPRANWRRASSLLVCGLFLVAPTAIPLTAFAQANPPSLAGLRQDRVL